MFLSDEGPTLETLDFTIRIGRVHQLTFFIFRLTSHLLYIYKLLSTGYHFSFVKVFHSFVVILVYVMY